MKTSVQARVRTAAERVERELARSIAFIKSRIDRERVARRDTRSGRAAAPIDPMSGPSWRRLVEVASADSDRFLPIGSAGGSMLSEAEILAVYQLVRHALSKDARIAELGAYTGGTTVLFGEALRRLGSTARTLEVYDFFEHNSTSRRRLSADPDFDNASFFPIWQRTTAPYADLVELHRGDLSETARASKRPLDLLYVDIVKHESLINPVMNSLLPRLQPGGFLVHQDYFHWQSPWVTYSTEAVIDHFEIVGTVSNHMMILQLRSPVDSELLSTNYLDGLSRKKKVNLMRQAMARQHGIRRGLLNVSLLNLAGHWDEVDAEREAAAIRSDYAAAPRVIRYLDEALKALTVADRNVW